MSNRTILKPFWAFTFIELLVVISVVAVLSFIMLPSIAKARARAQRIHCVSFLKQIGLSFREYAVEHNHSYPMSVSTNFGGTMEYIATGDAFRHFQVMSNELSTPKILVCPSDRSRGTANDFGPDFSNANVSYFVGLDVDESAPEMLLAGDANLAVGGVPAKTGVLGLSTNSEVTWTASYHIGVGDIALSDGSVQQATSQQLRGLLLRSGVTNRLVLP